MSDRALAAWCVASGLTASGGRSKGEVKRLNGFGLSELEGFLPACISLAAARRRHVIVADVRQNLFAAGRRALVRRFSEHVCKAVVLMGTPPKAYLEKVRAIVLADKRKQKETEVDAKRKTHEAKAKQALQVKAEEAAKAKDGEKGDEPMANGAEPEPDWEAMAAVPESDVADVTVLPPKGIQLVNRDIVSREFAEYSLPVPGAQAPAVDARWLPEGEAAPDGSVGGCGFDDVSFAWAKKSNAATFFAEWMREKKLHEKFTGLDVSSYAKEQLEEWSTKKLEWRKKQREYEEKHKGKEVELGNECELTAENVDDVYTEGTPLYSEFGTEDWDLLHLRFELRNLVLAFRKDATEKDPERKGIVLPLVGYYYQKFYGKTLFAPAHGQESIPLLIKYVSDTVKIGDGDVLTLAKAEDAPWTDLLRVTEEVRRIRANRIAAGDESAKLVFARQQAQKRPPPPPQKGNSQRGQPGKRPTGPWSNRPVQGRPAAPAALRPRPSARPVQAVVRPASAQHAPDAKRPRMALGPRPVPRAVPLAPKT